MLMAALTPWLLSRNVVNGKGCIVNTKYAIVNIFGRQTKVKEGDVVRANFTESAIGAQLSFNEVVFLNDGSKAEVGLPLVSGAKVTATVSGHTRGDKVIVFKYLRKNKLKKTQGHKQPYTLLKIESISV